MTAQAAILDRLGRCTPRPRRGYVTACAGPVVTAALSGVAVGTLCRIGDGAATAGAGMPAEVIAIDGDRARLAPFGGTDGIATGQPVVPTRRALSVMAGPALLGRVIDAFGQPLDGGPAPAGADLHEMPLRAVPVPPLDRPLIDTPFATGLRAIDGPNTLGEGQRIGLFGPPGTGKTSLLGAVARQARADHIVLGLIGERGREVREFLDRELPAAARDRVITVVATSDRPAVERALCPLTATAMAEALRDRGGRVLLLIDSLTRMARALREIGLAAGEPPARRGYPASVYPALPRLIERAGRAPTGSITALYTVLTEDDDDPIADEVRSLTDGHLILSRSLAQAGHWPAIDVAASVSRLIGAVAPAEQVRLAARMKDRLARHADLELLIQVGEYAQGADPEADAAVAAKPRIDAFLRQDQPLDEGWDGLVHQMRVAVG